MMNIPPKSIKRQLVRNAPETAQRIQRPGSTPGIKSSSTRAQTPTIRIPVDLADIGDVTAESLPVLKAFQDFLEAERKHARRQVMAVTAFFLLLFLIVAGAGTFFGYVYFAKLNEEVIVLRGDLNRAKTSVKEETSEMLLAIAQKTDALTARMTDGDSLIKKATSDMSSTVSKSISASLVEIDDIKRSLASLQEENRGLRQSIARMRNTPPEIPQQGPTVAAASPATLPEEKPAIITAVKETPTPPIQDILNPLELAILAPGSSEMIKWRIPISE